MEFVNIINFLRGESLAITLCDHIDIFYHHILVIYIEQFGEIRRKTCTRIIIEYFIISSHSLDFRNICRIVYIDGCP